MHYKIREPIWKNYSVGLAESKLDENNTVEITYKKKDGDRLYPGIYHIRKGLAMLSPVKMVRGVKLRIVMIDQLTKGE